MAPLQIVIIAAISYVAVMFLSWKGNDDSRDAASTRFFIVKMMAAVSGGCLAAIVVNTIFGLSFSENVKTIFIGVWIGLVFCFIGMCQNQIRAIQGRPQRPVIDLAIFRRGKK